MTKRDREENEQERESDQERDRAHDSLGDDRSSPVEALLGAMRRANHIIAQLQRRAREVQAIPDSEKWTVSEERSVG